MKVSVLVTACEHEDHVGEALDSVRMQRMTFELEVLVSVTADGPGWKSASFLGDGDFEVLGESVQEAEGPRLRRLLERATGEYVARLHTCDFWLREDKLKLQVEALEARPDAHVCVHDTILFYEDGSKPATELPYESLLGPDGLLSVREPLDPSSVVMRRRPAACTQRGCGSCRLSMARCTSSTDSVRLLTSPIRGGASRVRQSAVTREGRIRRLERPPYAARARSSIRGFPLPRAGRVRLEQYPDVARRRAGRATRGRRARAKQRRRGTCRAWRPQRAPFSWRCNRLRRWVACGRPGGRSAPRARACEGASYLVVPAAGRWWLEEYTELAEYLDASHERVWVDADAVFTASVGSTPDR